MKPELPRRGAIQAFPAVSSYTDHTVFGNVHLEARFGHFINHVLLDCRYNFKTDRTVSRRVGYL